MTNGLLVVKELPAEVLNDLLINIDNSSSVHSVSLSIEAFETIKFKDPALNFHKNEMRLSLFDNSKVNELIG